MEKWLNNTINPKDTLLQILYFNAIKNGNEGNVIKMADIKLHLYIQKNSPVYTKIYTKM